ncbi:MAG: carbohydrate kinase family protein [Chloroflexota bacterium]
MTILVVGDANADASATLSRFPSEGDDSSINMLQWSSGGSAANVATALALLGHPVRLIARVGTDPAAEIALRAAHTVGVDCSAIQHDIDTVTGQCFVAISPNGERTFLSFRGANNELASIDKSTLPDDWQWLHIAGHALLEGQQRNTTWQLIEHAQQRQIPISLDLCLPLIHSHSDDIHTLIPHLQILFANKPELFTLFAHLSEELAPTFFSTTNNPSINHLLIALKLGADGCHIMSQQDQLVLPTITVQAVDTTGCGDAFVAGFLDRYLNHSSWSDCAVYANALGTLTAMRYGSGEALPSRIQIQTFIDTYNQG